MNLGADTISDDKETVFSTEESEQNPHVHVDGMKYLNNNFSVLHAKQPCPQTPLKNTKGIQLISVCFN